MKRFQSEEPFQSRLLLDSVLLICFCGFLFFFGLGSFGLVGADEPRYAQIAREMMVRHDWITPTLAGGAWLEKPPLYYWQSIVAYRVFGISDWAARLPSAADATLMVIAVYFFLRRFRRGSALDGALIVASSAGVVGFARAASTDMPLAATFTIALLAWYAWFDSKKNRYLMLFYCCLALGTLAKGPVAVLLAVLVLISFSAVKRNLRPIGQTVSIPGILMFCAISLPWYIAVQIRNPGFFRVFILQHNLARFGTNLYHHAEPWWFFLLVFILGLLPWTYFALRGLSYCVQGFADSKVASEKNYPAFLALWVIVPVIFFSISRSKLPGYILPAFPAGALLASDYIRRHRGTPRLQVAIGHAVTACMPLLPVLMVRYLVLEHRVPWGRPVEYALGVVIAGIFVVTASLKISGMSVLRTVTLIPTVLSVAILMRVGSPVIDSGLSTRTLAADLAQVQSRLGQGRSRIGAWTIAVFEAQREIEYGLQFYLNRPIARYENHEIPLTEHIVVAPSGSQNVVAQAVAGRRVSYLGTEASQKLDYFLVSDSGVEPR